MLAIYRCPQNLFAIYKVLEIVDYVQSLDFCKETLQNYKHSSNLWLAKNFCTEFMSSLNEFIIFKSCVEKIIVFSF
jgi:hypothetical protein